MTRQNWSRADITDTTPASGCQRLDMAYRNAGWVQLAMQTDDRGWVSSDEAPGDCDLTAANGLAVEMPGSAKDGLGAPCVSDRTSISRANRRPDAADSRPGEAPVVGPLRRLPSCGSGTTVKNPLIS